MLSKGQDVWLLLPKFTEPQSSLLLWTIATGGRKCSSDRDWEGINQSPALPNSVYFWNFSLWLWCQMASEMYVYMVINYFPKLLFSTKQTWVWSLREWILLSVLGNSFKKELSASWTALECSYVSFLLFLSEIYICVVFGYFVCFSLWGEPHKEKHLFLFLRFNPFEASLEYSISFLSANSHKIPNFPSHSHQSLNLPI